jgi:hypothetical protein
MRIGRKQAKAKLRNIVQIGEKSGGDRTMVPPPPEDKTLITMRVILPPFWLILGLTGVIYCGSMRKGTNKERDA